MTRVTKLYTHRVGRDSTSIVEGFRRVVSNLYLSVAMVQ